MLSQSETGKRPVITGANVAYAVQSDSDRRAGEAARADGEVF